MPDLQKRFDKAAQEVKKLSARPDDDTLLQLYGLYKQSTIGDASGDRPGMFNLVDRAKFDAWARLRGTEKDASMQDYIDLVEKLKKA